MHHPVPRSARILVTAIAVLALAVAPVAAKEGLEARLDAPIPMGTPGGTELLVGVTVTFPDESGVDRPVEGTPVYLKLFGPDGASTRAAGAGDRTPGHYTMRITVPEGGTRGIEVGIHGTTDLAIVVMDSPLVAGGVTPSTAQVAPAEGIAAEPVPRVAEPAVGTALEPVGAGPAPAASAPAASAPVLVALLAGAIALLLVGLALARRRRAASDEAPTTPASRPA